MTEATPLVRQWILLRTLCAQHYGSTVKELSAQTGVGERTIRRDLEAFQTAGFPLIESVGQFGRKSYRIAPDKSQPGLPFAYDEAIALYLGRRFLEPLAGTIFWESAQRAFKKIQATLGKEALKYVDQFASVFHQTTVGASDYSQKAELIDTLMQGIEDCRATFITYRSLQATESVTYDVYPLGLTYHRGSLYLVGQKVERGLSQCSFDGQPTEGWSGPVPLGSQVPSPGTDPRSVGRGQREGGLMKTGTGSTTACTLALPKTQSVVVPVPVFIAFSSAQGEGGTGENPIRHWKVDRIEDARLEELRFNRPDGFDLQTHFAKSFGIFHGNGEVHVSVRFSATVARYVQESQWHASQKLTQEKDGSLLAEFDLGSTEEIMRWIMSFGRHAEVLEPEELRSSFADEVRHLGETYAKRRASASGEPAIQRVKTSTHQNQGKSS